MIELNRKTIIELNKYIEACTNYNRLSATRMARKCNVSRATISRYVKYLGYENFNHLKYSLIEKNMIDKNFKFSDDNITRKLNYINYCLREIKEFDFNQLILLDKTKILVYYDQQFEYVAKLFVEKMNLIHGNFQTIYSLSELEYQMKKNENDCAIISIGEIPDMLYKKEYQYLEIKYQKEREISEVNIQKISLLNRRQGMKMNRINTNILTMFTALDILVEEYSSRVLSNEEKELLRKHLL